MLLGAFSRYDEALDWARQETERLWGPIALVSEAFAFDDTQYYEPSMGPDLKKTFFAFDTLIDSGELAQIKCSTNELEEQYGATHPWPESRPLNLDPGYLTEAKLVLATTKDRDHRIHLGHGIFAEVTLYYHGGAWLARDWTYPDYRSPKYHEFLNQCRDFLRTRLRESD